MTPAGREGAAGRVDRSDARSSDAGSLERAEGRRIRISRSGVAGWAGCEEGVDHARECFAIADLSSATRTMMSVG